ncbi:MAG TPA: GntR family transcriptional regulator [Pseudonocardiaceae bacterium]|nr:GntR family transcriptional regulator [Pseudonocardiaceae bacterium]
MAKTGSKTYTTITDTLRDQITNGALEPNTWLSETQLIHDHGVTRYAARQVIHQLALEGLVTVVDGKGSYVRARRDRAAHTDHRDITNGHGHFGDADTPGWVPIEQPSTYRTDATTDVALTMGIPEHGPLFVYDRLLGQDTRRVSHRLYLPVATCMDSPALTDNPFRDPAELYTTLTAAGHPLRWIETVRAQAPTGDDTTTLHVPPGSAVLLTRRLTLDQHTGRALALEETRRSADDTQLTYTLTPVTTEHS